MARLATGALACRLVRCLPSISILRGVASGSASPPALRRLRFFFLLAGCGATGWRRRLDFIWHRPSIERQRKGLVESQEGAQLVRVVRDEGAFGPFHSGPLGPEYRSHAGREPCRHARNAIVDRHCIRGIDLDQPGCAQEWFRMRLALAYVIAAHRPHAGME